MNNQIVLLGYMASGKSLVGKKLAEILDFEFIDLDEYIEEIEEESINEIFVNKGEIYFRNSEHTYLKKILNAKKRVVISLGGGTPCYANNMNLLIDQKVNSVYLKVSNKILVERLFKEKNHRPLIQHLNTKDDMREFVGKHVFERSQFYNQAIITIDVNKNSNEVVESIICQLF